ncbi:unnamed protein product [Prunus armeniaca]
MGSDSQTCNRTLGYPIGRTRTGILGPGSVGLPVSTIPWLLGFPHMALAVPVWWEGHEICCSHTWRWQCRCMGRVCILLSIITHGVGSAGVGMILSARVGLDMRYEICELHVALAVPACELWSSVPRLDYSSLDAGSGSKILRTSQQSPGWIVFPGTLVWREVYVIL